MNQAQEEHILKQVLNLPKATIKGYGKIDTLGWVFQIESSKKESICSHCGKKSNKLHQNHWYLVKDLKICGENAYLKINRRQWKCYSCKKPFSEELEWVDQRRGFSKRLASKVLEELRKSDIVQVAMINNLSVEEVETIVKDFQKKMPKITIKNLEKLGIDEIAWSKGKHNYCAVLVNIDTGEILRILPQRTKEVLELELMEWGEKVLKNVKEVSIDLWRGYESVVKKLMPNVCVVADRFHVMKQINQELDEARKKAKKEVEKIKNKQEKEKKLEVIKNSKYILLKNYKKLNEDEKNKLKEVQTYFPKLKLCYGYKEKFRLIYETSQNWQEGLLKIASWLRQVVKKNIFIKSRKTIKNWLEPIISYFDNRTTNGVVEGINNKLKLIKRVAYGFRNFCNFWTRVYINWHFKC